MGSLKIRWKRGRLWLAILAVLVLSIAVSGCSGASSSQEKNAKKQTEEQSKDKKEQDKKKDKEKTKAGEIPQGLLPGQTEGEGVDGNNETGEESSDVYVEGTSGGNKSQGVEQSVSGNGGSTSGGTGSSGNRGQKRTVSIQFSVDSSNADGSVSYGSAMTLSEGATVYDALAATGLSYTGHGYIEEIGGLWEKDFSAKSGWKYYVNGSAPMMSCADYVLKDGDSVQWVYTLNP